MRVVDRSWAEAQTGDNQQDNQNNRNENPVEPQIMQALSHDASDGVSTVDESLNRFETGDHVIRCCDPFLRFFRQHSKNELFQRWVNTWYPFGDRWRRIADT